MLIQKQKMLEQTKQFTASLIALYILAALATTGMHVGDIIKAALNNMALPIAVNEDKKFSFDSHHHTHVSKTSIDDPGKSATQKELRKYFQSSQKKVIHLLD